MVELEKLKKQQIEQLEAISGMSGEQAKEKLINSLKEEAEAEAISYVNEIMEEAKMTANMEAKKVVIKNHSKSCHRNSHRKRRFHIPHRFRRNQRTDHRTGRKKYPGTGSCHRS